MDIIRRYFPFQLVEANLMGPAQAGNSQEYEKCSAGLTVIKGVTGIFPQFSLDITINGKVICDIELTRMQIPFGAAPSPCCRFAIFRVVRVFVAHLGVRAEDVVVTECH